MFVQGGSIEFLDQSIGIDRENSLVEVSGGSFILQGKSKFTLSKNRNGNRNTRTEQDSSLLHVKSGNVRILQSSILELIEGSQVKVEGGSIQLSGKGELRLKQATTTVKKGSIVATENSIITGTKGNMEVTGGSLVISRNAKISVTDLTIRMTQGSIIGTDDSTLIFISSQISIEGGNFVLNDTSEGRLLRGTIMRITGGTVKKAPTTTFIMDKGSKIINRKEIFGGGAYVMPEDSGLDVTEEGEMNIDSNSEFR
jgi:hypothetical protein